MGELLVASRTLGRVCPMREAKPRKPNLPVIWYMQQTFCPAQIRKESKQCWDKRPGLTPAPRPVTGRNGKYYSWMTANSHFNHYHTCHTPPSSFPSSFPSPFSSSSSYSPVKLIIEQNLSFLWFIFWPVCPWLNILHWSGANIDFMIQCFTIKIKHLTTLYNICLNELSNIK